MASTLKGVESLCAPCPGMQLGEKDFVCDSLIPQEWLPERYEMGFNLMHSGKFGAEFLA